MSSLPASLPARTSYLALLLVGHRLGIGLFTEECLLLVDDRDELGRLRIRQPIGDEFRAPQLGVCAAGNVGESGKDGLAPHLTLLLSILAIIEQTAKRRGFVDRLRALRSRT
jgi:hypothetical protein